ncbi:2-aminoadipate aminotransferase [Pilimelia terevasa]|uniref:2-aminoadipate aminotransferase n=1 Tax=Pilimelia terevasa TaxID=53372 RepID=A0A8J3FL79_9ACTN|nr:PLP-dependent aminotransferase family protein [Pilimelia terevasa]GGK32650.1 2-aminoadipate aminotransferase [Pilimelia terevasa]
MTAQDLISFARGAPSLDIVDIDGLKAAAVAALDADPGGATAYGTSVGYPPLREWVAARHRVPVAQVLLTNGSLQADAFLFDALLGPGDDVVVENPTYDRTLLGLGNRGCRVHQVPLDAEGVDTGALRALLESGVRPKLAHIIPNYQNPAGVTLSLARRRELLALAAEYGFTVFEDDPYTDIRFRGEALPALQELAADVPGAVVVRAGSFTKTVCPGVRVGYLIGAPDLMARIAGTATNLYISPNMFAQATVHQFCVSGGFDRSIATVSAALGERARVLGEALRENLPDAAFTAPDGGYFLWVEFPADVPADKLAAAAAERGVAVVKGSDFVVDGGHHALRLAFSAVTVDRIREGVRRLADAVAAVRG